MSLDAWTPVWIRTAGEPAVDWAILRAPFADPFFEQTAAREMRHPFNLLFARETPLAALQRLGEDGSVPAPDGLIFHMSRSGSTLVAQMLAALPSAVVIAEAQPLDAIVMLHRSGRLTEDDAVRALRGAASALGRPRRGEQRCFVKLHASHVLALPLIASAFPNVPWTFLFREPREVLRSQDQTLGAEIFAVTAEDVPEHEYGARAVASYCDAALRHAHIGRALFVDYAALPGAVAGEILPFFGIALDDAACERLASASRRDTKRPGDFAPRPSPAADPRIDELAARWLDAPYAALRALATAPR